jgi:hypothetical protein
MQAEGFAGGGVPREAQVADRGHCALAHGLAELLISPLGEARVCVAVGLTQIRARRLGLVSVVRVRDARHGRHGHAEVPWWVPNHA